MRANSHLQPSHIRPRSHAPADIFEHVHQVRRREQRLDDTIAQSFPASDPPGWTLGPNHRPNTDGA